MPHTKGKYYYANYRSQLKEKKGILDIMPGDRKSDNLIVGLSLGTTKTTMIVAERNPDYPDSVHVIGLALHRQKVLPRA